MEKNNKASAAQTAAERFTSGYRCSEAIMTTYCERVGLSRDQAMKIGCAFGGGMGSCGEMCGAVTAAVVILGLKYGRTDKNDGESRAAADSRVRTFLEKFKEKHKRLRCNELIGYDRSTPEGHEIAAAAGVFKTLCPGFVKDAALILEELL